MARRKPAIALAEMVAGVATLPRIAADGTDDDELTEALLDATADLLADYGLRRWSIDDVAERSGVGRTTIYRKFSGRDELVHAVLARELRDTIAAIEAGVARYERVEDRVAEGALIALAALRGSLVERLLHSDPATFLPFLTTGAGPLLQLARSVLASHVRAIAPGLSASHAEELAEVGARLGLSFILTRESVFPMGDEAATRDSLRRFIAPLVAPPF